MKKVVIIRSTKKKEEELRKAEPEKSGAVDSSFIKASKNSSKPVENEPIEVPSPTNEKIKTIDDSDDNPIVEAKKKNPGFKWYYLALFALVFGLLGTLVGCGTMSPLYAGYSYGVNETDPLFFLYLGFSLNNGSLPYIGIYDQKGMYIFTFEAVGYALGGKIGVYALLFLYASIVSFALMMSTKKLGGGYLSELLVGVTHMALTMAFKYGNHTGDLLMPWVALSIMFYIFGVMDKKERYFLIGSFFAGLMAAFGLTSRPTEAIWAVSFVVFYFIYWLRHEKNLNLLWNALIAILGCAIPVGVYSLMALKGGYFNEMIYATITQNFSYVGQHVYGVTVVDQVLTAVGVAFCLILFFPVKKKHGLDIALFFLVMAILAGGVNIYIARFPHYWLTAIPPFILVLYLAFAPVDELSLLPKAKKIYKSVIISLSGACVVMGVLWPTFYYGMKEPLGLTNGGEFSSTYYENKRTEAALDKYIKSSPTFEEDTVFGLDGKGAALLYLGKTSPERFACYTSWQSIDNPKIEPEVLSYLNGPDAPDWIISTSDQAMHTLSSFKEILNSDYTKVYDKYDDIYLTIFEANAHRA